jgi:hypothetical protein
MHGSRLPVCGYFRQVKLGGMIHLQNIAERRPMDVANCQSLKLCKKLCREHCGEDALDRIILGTTSWEDVTSETGNNRENRLKEEIWREMIEGGSQVRRFTGPNHASAIEFVHEILRGFNQTAVKKEPTAQNKHVDPLQQHILSSSRQMKKQLIKNQDELVKDGCPSDVIIVYGLSFFDNPF